MTATLRGESGGAPRAGYQPDRAESAKPQVPLILLTDELFDQAVGDTLDLTGTHPPRPPRGIVKHVVGCRVPPAHEYALRRRADEVGTSVSELLRDLIESELTMPADVRGWLLMQQRQCNAANEAETIVAVVRHLARRWPNGCRLAD